MFLILTNKFLDLSLDPSIFLIYVSNIFLGYVQLYFSVVFEDNLLYEIPEDFCHLKYNFCHLLFHGECSLEEYL